MSFALVVVVVVNILQLSNYAGQTYVNHESQVAPVYAMPCKNNKTDVPVSLAVATTATAITTPPASSSVRTTKNTTGANNHNKPRVLVGFFSYGVDGHGSVKRRGHRGPFKRRLEFRQYFNMVNDTRICALSQFLYGKWMKRRHKFKDRVKDENDECQFIYTFVSGFENNNTALPTELLANNRPIDNVQAYHERLKDHHEDFDMTFLNIQENMNEGKSQTWFKYAASVMDQYDIDYAIKTDMDSLIIMDHFFDFVKNYLPPAGKRIYAGVLADKAFWGGSRYGVDGAATVNYLREQAMVQIYMAGPLYVLSKDIVKWVSSKSFVNESWYEKIEDHDVGMRVYDYPEPIQTIRIQEDQRFWVHPAKDHLTWQLFMNRESNRKGGQDVFVIDKK